MNRIRSFLLLFVTAVLAMFSPGKAATVSAPPPTNYATLQFEHMFKSIARHVAIGWINCQLALDRILGFRSPAFGLGITADEQILKSLTEINDRVKKLDDVEKSVGDHKSAIEKANNDLAEVQKQVLAFQRQMLAIGQARQRRGGEVSLACARHLGALGLLAAAQQGRLTEDKHVAFAQKQVKDILGLEIKASLTSTDIPLPTEFAAEVVELVSEYGQARRYCTVYPLGAGEVKLPKLKTSPAFGLVAISVAAGEKSPQIEFVTFNAKKWGGLIILPNEIDDDSVVPMGQFIARYSAREMAKIEDIVVFTADGTATYDSLSGVLKQQDAAATRVVLASTKTAYSDVTLANLRTLRSKVASAALGRSAYYFHSSFEQHFATFNSAGDKPYVANGINGASLDGFPIRWMDSFPAFDTAANAGKVFGAFGEMSYTYLGVRGGMRYDASRDARFTTDELAIRALERFTVGHMASDHVAVIKTAAA